MQSSSCHELSEEDRHLLYLASRATLFSGTPVGDQRRTSRAPKTSRRRRVDGMSELRSSLSLWLDSHDATSFAASSLKRRRSRSPIDRVEAKVEEAAEEARQAARAAQLAAQREHELRMLHQLELERRMKQLQRDRSRSPVERSRSPDILYSGLGGGDILRHLRQRQRLAESKEASPTRSIAPSRQTSSGSIGGDSGIAARFHRQSRYEPGDHSGLRPEETLTPEDVVFLKRERLLFETRGLARGHSGHRPDPFDVVGHRSRWPSPSGTGEVRLSSRRDEPSSSSASRAPSSRLPSRYASSRSPSPLGYRFFPAEGTGDRSRGRYSPDLLTTTQPPPPKMPTPPRLPSMSPPYHLATLSPLDGSRTPRPAPSSAASAPSSQDGVFRKPVAPAPRAAYRAGRLGFGASGLGSGASGLGNGAKGLSRSASRVGFGGKGLGSGASGVSSSARGLDSGKIGASDRY